MCEYAVFDQLKNIIYFSPRTFYRYAPECHFMYNITELRAGKFHFTMPKVHDTKIIKYVTIDELRINFMNITIIGPTTVRESLRFVRNLYARSACRGV